VHAATCRPGRTSFAAMAAGMQKPIDGQPFDAWMNRMFWPPG
jgi:hypothetical protein